MAISHYPPFTKQSLAVIRKMTCTLTYFEANTTYTFCAVHCYHKHRYAAKYRNMLQIRILHLSRSHKRKNNEANDFAILFF